MLLSHANELFARSASSSSPVNMSGRGERLSNGCGVQLWFRCVEYTRRQYFASWLVWSSGMTSLSHREDPGFDPQHEHLFGRCTTNQPVFVLPDCTRADHQTFVIHMLLVMLKHRLLKPRVEHNIETQKAGMVSHTQFTMNA